MPSLSNRGRSGRRDQRVSSVAQRLTKQYIVLAVLVIFVLVMSIAVNHSTKDYLPAAAQEKQPMRYYSMARLDQSGAAIHDMLLAHAYAFHHGAVYGGACLRYLPFYPRRESVRLLRDLGWQHALHFSCPSSSKNAAVLPATTYRVYDGALFTETWRKAFLQQTVQKARSAPDPAFRIVVHIRRGDVNPCRFPNRYLPNNHYVRLIQKYTPANHSNVQVTIYSQNQSYEPFTVFTDRRYTLALDTRLLTVWQALISADVAILSKSSFSYAPATMNANTVVYTDFWHKALTRWERVDPTMLKQTATELERLNEEACRVLRPHKRNAWKRHVLPLIWKLLKQPPMEGRLDRQNMFNRQQHLAPGQQ